eukprot:15366821-Ditylum_brightwellii.AAC.2
MATSMLAKLQTLEKLLACEDSHFIAWDIPFSLCQDARGNEPLLMQGRPQYGRIVASWGCQHIILQKKGF